MCENGWCEISVHFPSVCVHCPYTTMVSHTRTPRESFSFQRHTRTCLLYQFIVTPWTIAHQAPLSIEFSRQGYWSGLSFPSPGDLPNPGIEPLSLLSPALADGFFTNCPSWEAPCVHAKSLSRVRLFATLWTVALQAPLSMGFSRQEYWSGLLGPPLGDRPDPGIKSGSLTSLAVAGRFFTTSATWEAWQAP